MFESASSNAPVPVRAHVRRGRLAGLFAAALLLYANPAAAASFFFDNTAGVGLSQETANTLDFSSIVSGVQAYSSFLSVTTAPQLPTFGAPSVMDPTTIQTTWSIANISAQDLSGTMLVLIQPVNYENTTTGLDVPNNGTWSLVQVPETQIYYPAISLGSLAPGESRQISFTHLVGSELLMSSSGYEAPQYMAGVVLNAYMVPEPVSILLLSGVLVGFAFWRRQES